MASKTEQRKIQIIADGSSVNASMEQMSKATRLMWQELQKLPPASEEFAKKSKAFQEVNNRLQETREAAKGAEQSLNDLANEALEMSPLGGIISTINGAFLKTKSVLATVSTGFNTLRGAIISTGLGALIVVLGLVINYFTTVEGGIEKVNRVLEPMKVLWQRTFGVLQEVGEFLANTFTDAINDPRKAFQDFSDFIVNNFLNRIKAVGVAFEGVQKIISGDILDGLKTLGDSMIQATTGVTGGIDKLAEAAKATGGFIAESVKQGQYLADLNEEIESAEIALTYSRAELNKKYQESLEIAKDQSKSEKERLAAAKTAREAEDELLTQEQAFIDMKIERMKLEQSFNDTSDEQYLELAQLEAERTNFEIEASRRRTKARSLENTVAKEIQAEGQKRSEEARKKQEAEDKRLADLRNEYLKSSLELERQTEDLRIAVMEEGAEKKIAQLTLKHEREIQAMAEQKAKILENETLTEEDRIAIQEQYRQLADLKEQEHKTAKEEIQKEEKLAKFEEDQALEIQLLENAMIGVIDAEQRKADALLEIQRHYAAEKLALLEAAGEGESLQALKLKNTILKIDQEIADGKIANEQKVKDAKQFLAQTQFEAAKGFMQLGIELLGEDMKARKAFINGFKAIQIGQIISDGVREIAAIWKNSMSNPMNALIPGFGQALAVAQTALAASRTGLAVNRIRSQQFAVGGGTGSGRVIDMVMDRSGTWRMPNGQSARNVGTFARGGRVGSASIGVIGEAGEEWVGPNWMIRSPKYANIFGYLEAERRKATPYATGGMTAAPMQIPQNSSATADLQQTMMIIEQFGELNMKFDMMISIMQAWPTRLRVVNDPRDILDGVRVLNEIESDSRINR